MSRLRSLGLGGVVLAAILFRVVPWLPSFPTANSESAWRQAVNEAVGTRMVFGTDILFTFGPYASVLTGQYHPATDRMAMLGSGLLGIALAAGLLALGRSRRAYPIVLIPLLMILSVIPDPFMLLEPLVFLALVCRVCREETGAARARDRYIAPTLLGLALALALLTLVKGTFIADAAATMLLACGTLAVRRRAGLAAALGLAFVLGIAGFWMLAGQPLAALPGFFLAERTVIGGYSEAMALTGPPSEVVVFLAGCLVVGAIAYAGHVRRFGLVGWVFGAGLALTLFLGFKAGFVRHDVHAVIAGATLALCAALLAIELSPLPAGAAIVAGLVAFLVIGADHREGVLASGRQIAHDFADVALGVRLRLQGGRSYDDLYAAVLDSLRVRWPQQPVGGTVDVYSSDQWGVLANRMAWSPRPDIQSTTAFSVALEEADRAHLEGARAPETIFLRVEPIDNRLPALEDGLSWPTLLSRYAVRGFDRQLDLARLERRAEPAEGAPSAIGDSVGGGTYALGQLIPVPWRAGALWATIDARPSAVGRLVDLLYKLPPLHIGFTLADGTTASYRYVAAMGQAGFVVSPLVRDTAGFLSLVLPQDESGAAADRPVAIAIAGESGTRWLWDSHIAVRFFSLDLPAQPDVAGLIAAR